MSNKLLSERLSDELDAIGVPSLMTERVQACSKLFKLPKFKIEALLHGVIIESKSIQTIADELAVQVEWLLGDKNAQKKRH